jgi:chromosome segregation ATPase
MQAIGVVVLLALVAVGDAATSNPLSKVIELMDALTAKIVKEGEEHEKAYHEYFEWCEDFSRETGFEIKTLTARKGKLEAAIAQASSNIDSSATAIEELAAAIATAEKELNDATLIREKEHADFAASEAELVEAIDTLTRAIAVLEREMQKNPAALVQVDTANLSGVLQAMSAVLDAAAFSSTDLKKLTALMQSKQSDDGDDEDLGAPAPKAYKTHSNSIVDVLEDMKDKAEGELSDARRAETNAMHNFNMLKQSLEDKMSADNKDMEEQRAEKAAAEEAKAVAEGDLATTEKALAEAQAALAECNRNCMQVATDHAETVKGRSEELAAIAQAKKILEESTGGAESQTYSLLQTSSSSKIMMRARTNLASADVIALLKRLADEHHSTALTQLASRVSAVMKFGATGGDDVFAKVKGLIQDMIDKLLKEAAEEATEKAFCDEEMAKTKEKKEDLESDIAKLTSKIDVAAARSAKLKDEVKTLQEELAALAKLQAEMDKTRAEENAAFVQAKADLEQGLNGVRQAISVLRDYYAEEETALMQQPAMPEKHVKAGGAGGGIVNILEVVEADFAKNLAQEEQEEADAQAEYDTMTQENKITTATKQQDAKYKTQEHTKLDSSIADLSGDRDTANTELNAVLDYYDKLKDRCIAKPETYEERTRRREAEIAGLKQALQILEGESAFLQRGLRR